MRSNKVKDLLRALDAKPKDNWPTRILSIQFENLDTFGSLEFEITSPITVIAGANGVGKTTLLKAVWVAISNAEEAAKSASDRRLFSGSLKVQLEHEGQELEFESTLTSEETIRPSPNPWVELPILRVDGAASSANAKRTFERFQSPDEFLNGVAGRDLDEKQIQTVRSILGRDYRSIRVYEPEIADGQTAPYFELTYGNDLYDSRTMGTGEAAALYVWWALDRADPAQLILIEEPEAFLSAGSQSAIAEFFLSQVVKKQQFLLLSTHSSQILQFLPPHCLKFFSRTDHGISHVSDRPPRVLLEDLGVPLMKVGVLSAEDRFSMRFSQRLIERFDADLALHLDFECVSGSNEVAKLVSITKGFSNATKIIGVLDGDERQKNEFAEGEPILFLPGDEAPEKLFIDFLKNSPDALEPHLPSEQLLAILAALEGKDHHDWMSELQKELNLTPDQLLLLVFNAWIIVEENEMQAIEFVEEVKSILDA